MNCIKIYLKVAGLNGGTQHNIGYGVCEWYSNSSVYALAVGHAEMYIFIHVGSSSTRSEWVCMFRWIVVSAARQIVYGGKCIPHFSTVAFCPNSAPSAFSTMYVCLNVCVSSVSTRTWNGVYCARYKLDNFPQRRMYWFSLAYKRKAIRGWWVRERDAAICFLVRKTERERESDSHGNPSRLRYVFFMSSARRCNVIVGFRNAASRRNGCAGASFLLQ